MIKKTELLQKLSASKQGQKNDQLDKKVVLDLIGNHFTPKTGEKSKFLNKVSDNSDLAKPKKSIAFESSFSRPRHDIRTITRKVILESETQKQMPNAMRLDLKSIVMDNIHAKFDVVRGGNKVVVELLYPNTDNEITIKVSIKDGEDKISTVNLEDDAFTQNFGAYILKEVDNAIQATKNKSGIKYTGDNQSTFNTPVGGDAIAPVQPGFGGYSPVWESAWTNAMALIEADEEEQDPDVEIPAVGDVNADSGDAFGEEDFSLDSGAPSDSAGGGSDSFSGDFGGSGSLSSLGGGMVPSSSGDVNSDAGSTDSGEPEEDYVQFREKDDWTQPSLDTMQKLTAESTAKQMQNGNGVVLSSNDVLKGTVGIENDSNYQIIDKFLKIYTELDGVDIPVSMLNEIEDKLSKNDGQFDSFLQQNLSKITGQSQVDDVLNNEMFADFKPMGGENKTNTPAAGLDPFDEFMDDLGGSDVGGEQPQEEGFDFGDERDDSGDEDIIKGIAEKSVGKAEDVFPNLS